MSVIWERHVAGGKGRNPAGQEEWILKVFGSVISFRSGGSSLVKKRQRLLPLISPDNSSGCLGGNENLNAQAVSMTVLAHKGIELAIPMQVSDDNFHKLGLGAGEHQLSLAVCNATEIDNLDYLICLHRPTRYINSIIETLINQWGDINWGIPNSCLPKT
jgi:hypothetical protein